MPEGMPSAAKSALLSLREMLGTKSSEQRKGDGFGGRRHRGIGAQLQRLFGGDFSRIRAAALLALLALFSGIAIYQLFDQQEAIKVSNDRIARAYTELTLKPDYSLDVREIYEIELSADSERKGFVRSVALEYLDSNFTPRRSEISKIQLLDDARGIEILNPKTEQVEGRYKIWIGDPENPLRAGVNRFVLLYSLSGVVEEGTTGGDILQFGVSDLGMPLLNAAQVRLNVDPKLRLQNLRASGWINLNQLTEAARRVEAGEPQVLMLPARDNAGVKIAESVDSAGLSRQSGAQKEIDSGGGESVSESSEPPAAAPTSTQFFELLRPLELGESFAIEVRFG